MERKLVPRPIAGKTWGIVGVSDMGSVRDARCWQVSRKSAGEKQGSLRLVGRFSGGKWLESGKFMGLGTGKSA